MIRTTTLWGSAVRLLKLVLGMVALLRGLTTVPATRTWIHENVTWKERPVCLSQRCVRYM
jgi:hypothetical protein